MKKQSKNSKIKSAFIFHGVFGYPEENWFPWLEKELLKKGIKVYVPSFPTPENQTFENWLKVFDNYRIFFDENSILIGHSLGTLLIFRLLEKANFKIKASIIVAPFYGFTKSDEINSLIVTFVDHDFDWKKIESNCEQFYIYCSDNDPYIPIEQPQIIARKLHTQNIKIIHQAGHFNSNAGYSTFPDLLNNINTLY